MATNSLLKKLGRANNDRLVIIHTDDIGMCHASVQAFKDLWEFGTITSGALMVQCAWFPAVAQMCRENQINVEELNKAAGELREKYGK